MCIVYLCARVRACVRACCVFACACARVCVGVRVCARGVGRVSAYRISEDNNKFETPSEGNSLTTEITPEQSEGMRVCAVRVRVSDREYVCVCVLCASVRVCVR